MSHTYHIDTYQQVQWFVCEKCRIIYTHITEIMWPFMMDNGYIELIPLSTTRHPIDSLKIVYKQHLYVDRGRQGDTVIGAARFLLSHDIFL